MNPSTVGLIRRRPLTVIPASRGDVTDSGVTAKRLSRRIELHTSHDVVSLGPILLVTTSPLARIDS